MESAEVCDVRNKAKRRNVNSQVDSSTEKRTKRISLKNWMIPAERADAKRRKRRIIVMPQQRDRRARNDPQVESNVANIQRGQGSSPENDYESEKSDEEVDGCLFFDDPVEEDRVKFDEEKRNRNTKPLEKFMPVNARSHPDLVPEVKFIRRGDGRASFKTFKDKKPWEIAEYLLRDVIDHTVKMYNLHRDADVAELTEAKFSAWLGIHLFLSTWQYPDWKRYWGGEKFGGFGTPNFDNIMSFKEWVEIRRNLRFEDYDKESTLAATDKAWKIRPLITIMKNTLRRVNPAPGQYLSLNAAMTPYTGLRCPIVVEALNKPICRGIKLYVLTDMETGLIVDFNVHDGSVTPEMGRKFSGGVVGLHVEKLLSDLKGSGHVVFLENFDTTIAFARRLLDRNIRLVGTLRKGAMTDCQLVKFSAAECREPRLNPRGTHKVAKTEDGKIFTVGLMDAWAMYFVDTAFGYKLAEVRRRGLKKDRLLYMAPRAVSLYNEHMGGLEGQNRHQMDMHGFEGVGRSHKWTSKFFDFCVSMLMQTAYSTYKCCRDNNLGNEEPMSHADFDESVISYFLHNSNWKREKLSLSKGSRAPVRDSDAVSSVSSVSIPPTNARQYHTMERNDDKYGSNTRRNRTIAYLCRVCGSRGSSGDCPARTFWYCKECSATCLRKKDRVYLHPQCFGVWHDRLEARRAQCRVIT